MQTATKADSLPTLKLKTEKTIAFVAFFGSQLKRYSISPASMKADTGASSIDDFKFAKISDNEMRNDNKNLLSPMEQSSIIKGHYRLYLLAVTFIAQF